MKCGTKYPFSSAYVEILDSFFFSSFTLFCPRWHNTYTQIYSHMQCAYTRLHMWRSTANRQRYDDANILHFNRYHCINLIFCHFLRCGHITININQSARCCLRHWNCFHHYISYSIKSYELFALQISEIQVLFVSRFLTQLQVNHFPVTLKICN